MNWLTRVLMYIFSSPPEQSRTGYVVINDKPCMVCVSKYSASLRVNITKKFPKLWYCYEGNKFVTEGDTLFDTEKEAIDAAESCKETLKRLEERAWNLTSLKMEADAKFALAQCDSLRNRIGSMGEHPAKTSEST